MSDFRNILGSKISLCLPDAPIVDEYVKVLTEKAYEIENIIILYPSGRIAPRKSPPVW